MNNGKDLFKASENQNILRPMEDFRKQVNSLFHNFFDEVGLQDSALKMPAVDIMETEELYIVHAEIPGMNEQDLEIELENGVLSIKGEKKQLQQQQEERFHRMERTYGRFHRTISLPGNVDEQNIEATCQKGVLSIRIPKLESTSKARRIVVQQG